MTCLRSKAGWRWLVILFVMSVRCSGSDHGASASRPAQTLASDIVARLSDGTQAGQISLFLASATYDQLGVCAKSASEPCTTSHPTYRRADTVFIKGGRKILAVAGELPAGPSYRYAVVDPQGNLIAQFQIAAAAAGDPIATGLALMSESVLKDELTYITRDEFKGRLAATAENDRIADWLIEKLQQLAIPAASGTDYRQRFELGVGPTGDRETANIVGKLEGNDPVLKDEYIVIGAHMDHAGTLSRGYTCSDGDIDNDSICNGADDNGSGTIAVLNVAKALSAVRSQLKRSVIIMWFSGEEEGLIGSYYYTKKPLIPLSKTKYMVNLDMVGYMRSFENGLAALGGGSAAFSKKILQDIAKRYPEHPLEITSRAGGGSDHVPFMSKGIPGVFFHTGVSNNPNYHRTSDHVERIDFPGMVVAAKIAFETVARIANLDGPLNRTYDGVPLITEEEMQQTCHHLIANPYIKVPRLDFTNSNNGRG